MSVALEGRLRAVPRQTPWPTVGNIYPLDTPAGTVVFKVVKSDQWRVTLVRCSERELDLIASESEHWFLCDNLVQAITFAGAMMVLRRPRRFTTAEREAAEALLGEKAERAQAWVRYLRPSWVGRLMGRR